MWIFARASSQNEFDHTQSNNIKFINIVPYISSSLPPSYPCTFGEGESLSFRLRCSVCGLFEGLFNCLVRSRFDLFVDCGPIFLRLAVPYLPNMLAGKSPSQCGADTKAAPPAHGLRLFSFSEHLCVL